MTDVSPRPAKSDATRSVPSPLGGGSTAAPPDQVVEKPLSGPTWGAAVDGVIAGAVSIGVATLLAGVLTWLGLAGGTPSPIPAVAGAIIDRTPPWLKDFAVATFGTNDKLALTIGMVVVLVVACAGIGVLSKRRPLLAAVLLGAVGVLGMAAVISRPDASGPDVLPTLLGTAAGIDTLMRLRPRPSDDLHEGSWSPLTRRRVMAGGSALVAGFLGMRLDGSRGSAREARAQTVIPTPTLTPSIDGASVNVDGVTPFIVPNDDFYRIDTAFVVPQLDTASWSLRVWGDVEQEVTIDWATLLKQPLEQHLITLTCVSNEVGGELAGNALWTGWPVRKLLAMAKPKPGADMVLSRSSDGFTAGTPIEALTDERNAMIAVAMNGQALPFEHGFPARLVVPGHYGYVSATKWLTELKVTRFSADEGYWTPRGWSAMGPIKTASRIDVPRAGRGVKAGTVAVAGVAWAQHRGITKVEVQVDDGPWQPATLAAEATVDSWRQWVLMWAATPGTHQLRVRATDATGATQKEQPAPPAPDGATGWHAVQVEVS
jgi:DMSO/TMAO reductase YedYZ molybdopterin-dependent catalytic subunit